MFSNNANIPSYVSERSGRNEIKNQPKRSLRRINFSDPPQIFSTYPETKSDVPILPENVRNLSTFFISTFKQFSDNTTMHGFRDLYYSKSLLWKFIWLLAILTTVSLSGYQVYSTTMNYLDKPKVTLIQPLTSNVEYPPLTICYIHWLFWVDWKRVRKLGFDKQTTLYAMSFLGEIVSETKFEVDETKNKFKSIMKSNGITKMADFYKAVAFPTPPGILVQYVGDSVKWTKFLNPAYSQLCYGISSDHIKHVLFMFAEVAPNTINTIEMAYNHTYLEINTDYISVTEYEIYIEKFIATFVLFDSNKVVNMKYNISQLKVSPTFNFNNVRTNIFMLSEFMFEARVRLEGALYKWMNDDQRPCASKKSVVYDFCDKFCHWKYVQQVHPDNCIEVAGAGLIGEHNFDKLCTYNVYFLPDFDVWPGTSSPTAYVLRNETQSSCTHEYCLVPCDVWKFVTTLTTIPFPSILTNMALPTLLDVEYPFSQQIIVFTEVPSVTWETMIGDIGGIVGLWLGASIMSILQVIYLCCCSSCDRKISTVR